ncbi:MAG: hypothetical protein LC744_04080 [Chloroflexi bacterium]|nr:hypothetical protein [Chloroflexota bacterium]
MPISGKRIADVGTESATTRCCSPGGRGGRTASSPTGPPRRGAAVDIVLTSLIDPDDAETAHALLPRLYGDRGRA